MAQVEGNPAGEEVIMQNGPDNTRHQGQFIDQTQPTDPQNQRHPGHQNEGEGHNEWHKGNGHDTRHDGDTHGGHHNVEGTHHGK
ncbi:MAG: hypothetical protein LBE27_07840 [Deltaproteobacteria bacterium]|nr:hypothetical protein [Deltaproteobacteria bacterium]